MMDIGSMEGRQQRRRGWDRLSLSLATRSSQRRTRRREEGEGKEEVNSHMIQEGESRAGGGEGRAQWSRER